MSILNAAVDPIFANASDTPKVLWDSSHTAAFTNTERIKSCWHTHLYLR